MIDKHLGKGGVYLIFLLLLLLTSGLLFLYIKHIRPPVEKETIEKPTRPKKRREKKKKEVAPTPPPEPAQKKEKQGEETANFFKRYISIFKKSDEEITIDDAENEALVDALEETLAGFDVQGKVTNIISGPVITRFEYKPASGIKLSKISNLSDDLALALKAKRIRIVAPIPGKDVVGIEIPNKTRRTVYIRDFLESEVFRNNPSYLFVPIGKDITGAPYFDDITSMPHLLVAGATGSGKSVFINSLLVSILSKSTPLDVRFIMIDPKRIELSIYNGIPHLLRPVITEPKEALRALKEAIKWMDLRYKEFAKVGVRNIEGYNKKRKEKKPYILIIIDELSDLMMTSGREIEDSLIRLAQMSRAVGIHLIIATQRPSVDVITGLIKANFPARISFQVASRHDSSTILDTAGAEKLLGKGDMLYLPSGKGVVERLHGAFVSTEEARAVANLWGGIHIKELMKGKIDNYDRIADLIIDEEMLDAISNPSMPGGEERLEVFYKLLGREIDKKAADDFRGFIEELEYFSPIEEIIAVSESDFGGYMGEASEEDELFQEAKNLVIKYQTASVSFLQRKLKIGYARAGRLIDALEKAGIVGPYKGSKAREVLIKEE